MFIKLRFLDYVIGTLFCRMFIARGSTHSVVTLQNVSCNLLAQAVNSSGDFRVSPAVISDHC